MVRWLASADIPSFVHRHFDHLDRLCRVLKRSAVEAPEAQGDTPAGGTRSSSSTWGWIDVVRWTHRDVVLAGAVAAGGVILLTLFAGVDALGQASQSLSRQAPLRDHIVPVKPGGLSVSQDYAA
jgi:hypothetical protein